MCLCLPFSSFSAFFLQEDLQGNFSQRVQDRIKNFPPKKTLGLGNPQFEGLAIQQRIRRGMARGPLEWCECAVAFTLLFQPQTATLGPKA